MKVSIVTAVLNSPEIVRRQLFHYSKLDMTRVEVILVDDGSEPELAVASYNFSLRLLHTYDKRPWTQPAARNLGAKYASGDYLICADVDHIISQDVIDIAKNATADVIRFKRELGVLNGEGDFTQSWDILKAWGCTRGKLGIAPHGNSYIFKRSLYIALDGVDERFVGTGKYPNREEVPLKRKLKALGDNITIIDDSSKPTIYMFPNGKYCGDKDANPFGFFHSLSRERHIGRKTNKQIHRDRKERRDVRSKHNNSSS